MVLPIVLIKIFSCKERFKAYLYIGILTLIIVAFYYTKTRASFLGLIISNLFFFSFIGKKNLLANKTKTIVTITIIIGISVFFNVNNKASVIGRFIGDIKPVHLDNKSGEKTENLQSKHLAEQDLFAQPAPFDTLSQDPHLPARQRRSDGSDKQDSDWHIGLARQIEGTTLNDEIYKDYPIEEDTPDQFDPLNSMGGITRGMIQ